MKLETAEWTAQQDFVVAVAGAGIWRDNDDGPESEANVAGKTEPPDQSRKATGG